MSLILIVFKWKVVSGKQLIYLSLVVVRTKVWVCFKIVKKKGRQEVGTNLAGGLDLGHGQGLDGGGCGGSGTSGDSMDGNPGQQSQRAQPHTRQHHHWVTWVSRMLAHTVVTSQWLRQQFLETWYYIYASDLRSQTPVFVIVCKSTYLISEFMSQLIFNHWRSRFDVRCDCRRFSLGPRP